MNKKNLKKQKLSVKKAGSPKSKKSSAPKVKKANSSIAAARKSIQKKQSGSIKKKAKPNAGTKSGEEKEFYEVEVEKVKGAEVVISEGLFSEFVLKNIGTRGVELMKALNSAPHTDEKLASKLDVKVNEVRRMLNVLNGYGLTKYDIKKDEKGWLTFKWYLDREKLNTFYGVLQEKQNSQKVNLQENCNDFFYCNECYKEQKLILPFDSAYELNFKCGGCGKILEVLNKQEARALFDSGKLK
ncbi:MAG: hypothetical protein QXF01_00725 [Candidatus Micrarchaeaceae archaeon]